MIVKERHLSRKSKRRHIIAVVSVLAVTVAITASLFFTGNIGAPRAETETTKKATPQQDTSSYEVFSQKPKSLRIPSLDISAPIVPVGLTAGGAMDAPATLSDVGWYEKSANVGEDSGRSILTDGHYGSSAAPGIFHNLYNIKIDDPIYVLGENGKEAVYRVVEIERKALEDVDMKKALRTYPGAKQSLTLITCEGEYDPSRATYDDRVVVYAVRAS